MVILCLNRLNLCIFGNRKEKRRGLKMEKNKKQPTSGHMVNDMEDLKQLGKQMENMRDGQQLEEDDRIVDPQQFDKLDEK